MVVGRGWVVCFFLFFFVRCEICISWRCLEDLFLFVLDMVGGKVWGFIWVVWSMSVIEVVLGGGREGVCCKGMFR